MPDPLDPRAWNRFGYVYGNPANFTDPSGHFPLWDFLDVGSFALGLVDFLIEPSWANAGWLALDAVGLLPFIPGVAGARHVGGLGGAGDALRAAQGGGGYTTLYRFANDEGDLVSALSKLKATNPKMYEFVLKRLEKPGQLDQAIMEHATDTLYGFYKHERHNYSPFISTVENLEAAVANADPEVFQKIIYGTTDRPAAKYIYELSVPNNLIHRVPWETAERETERLVLADTVVPYITGVKPNHFARFR